MKRWSRNKAGELWRVTLRRFWLLSFLSTHQLFLGVLLSLPLERPGPLVIPVGVSHFLSAGTSVFKNSLHPHPNLVGLSFCTGLPALQEGPRPGLPSQVPDAPGNSE